MPAEDQAFTGYARSVPVMCRLVTGASIVGLPM